jgi:hypothetical protein
VRDSGSGSIRRRRSGLGRGDVLVHGFPHKSPVTTLLPAPRVGSM